MVEISSFVIAKLTLLLLLTLWVLSNFSEIGAFVDIYFHGSRGYMIFNMNIAIFIHHYDASRFMFGEHFTLIIHCIERLGIRKLCVSYLKLVAYVRS